MLVNPLQTPIHRLSYLPHRLAPAEAFFNPLAYRLARLVAVMPRGAPIYCTAAATGVWSSGSSFGRKLLWLAQAWISVPSTEKCSFDSRLRLSARVITSVKNASMTSCSISRSRFLENTEFEN